LIYFVGYAIARRQYMDFSFLAIGCRAKLSYAQKHAGGQ